MELIVELTSAGMQLYQKLHTTDANAGDSLWILYTKNYW